MPDTPLKKAESTVRDKNQRMPADSTIIDEDERIVVHANYELFVLFISAFQVVNSILILALRGDPAHPIPIAINYALSFYLLIDFFVRLGRSRNRRRFFINFHGYLAFIGSLPFPFAGLFRLIGYGLVVRRLRRVDYQTMQRVVVRKEAQSAMLAIITAAVIVLEVSSIFILELESRSPDANIQNAADAIWWALVTMATVGYGDYFPVTMEGRFVAFIVMVVGVGIFTVLTSFFAQSFIRHRGEVDDDSWESPTLDDAQININAIRDLVDRQEASVVELRARLAKLEDQLKQ